MLQTGMAENVLIESDLLQGMPAAECHLILSNVTLNSNELRWILIQDS